MSIASTNRFLWDLNEVPTEDNDGSSSSLARFVVPEDYQVCEKARTKGKTIGRIDRFYISPDGVRLRSKVEVKSYLETGEKPKRKLKSKVVDDGSSGSTTSK